MIEKEFQFKQRRDPGKIITDSFAFLKREYKPVFKLLALYVLPFIVLYAIALVYIQKNIISKIDFSNAETLMSNIGPVYINLFIFSLFGIFVQSLLIGTYYSYIETYISKGKDNFTLSDVTSNLYSNGLLALGAGFLWFIAVMIGTVLCIVPGIYFANTFSIVFIIYILEKKTLGHAVTRSMFLVSKQWWNTFIINLTGLIIVWMAGFALSIPSMIAGLSANIFNVDGKLNGEYPEWYWFLIGLSTVISSLLWIIPYTFLALQYFNLDEQTKTV